MLTINQRQVEGLTILDLDGRVTIGQGSVQFREAIRSLLEGSQPRILLNFANVSYVDSSGIGELVSAYTTINKQGGKLKLLNLPQRIRDLLRITKLLTVFEIFDDESAAVSSFH